MAILLRLLPGVIVYGRSDATLNPGGVRIGTSEIYRTVESEEDVVDSIVVGYPVEGDVEVVLFVKMKPNFHKDQFEYSKALKKKIRTELTPRHVLQKSYMLKIFPTLGVVKSRISSSGSN